MTGLCTQALTRNQVPQGFSGFFLSFLMSISFSAFIENPCLGFPGHVMETNVCHWLLSHTPSISHSEERCCLALILSIFPGKRMS